MKSISIKEILELTKNKMEKKSDLLSITKGLEFEKKVGEILVSVSEENYFGLIIQNNGKHAFPDYSIKIGDRVYGLEIKFSNSGSWRSNGNSVFESISNKDDKSDEGYHEIFLLFGRKPTKKENIKHLEVMFLKYEEAISNIAVTHSPRYTLNMNTKGENFFSIINTSYKEFRILTTEEKNQKIRLYFQEQQSSKDKWYIPLDIEGDSTDLNPSVFEDLDKNLQNRLKSEAMVLFLTDLFNNSHANYKNIAEYFVNEYFVISSNLRDHFSAGGKKCINSLKDGLKYPQLLFQYESMQEDINSILTSPSEEFVEIAIRTWSNNEKLIDIDTNKDFKIIFEEIISNYKFSIEVRIDGENQLIEQPFLSEIYNKNISKYNSK